MKNPVALIFGALPLVVLGYPLLAHAADCDFDKRIGSCVGSIQITRTYGSKNNYGAEIVVHTSASQCSRVEYYVDGTPYQTVFPHKTSEPESVFGTRPISKKNITLDRCITFASKGTSKDEGGSHNAAGDLSGHWSGSVRWTFVSSGAEMDVRVSGNRATGTWTDGKSGAVTPFSGNVSGRTLTFAYVGQGDGSHGQGTFTLIGQNKATLSLAAASVTFSGTLTRN
jgi:hypothetical protein